MLEGPQEAQAISKREYGTLRSPRDSMFVFADCMFEGDTVGVLLLILLALSSVHTHITKWKTQLSESTYARDSEYRFKGNSE